MRKLLLPILLVLAINCFSQSQKNDLKLTVSGLPLFGTSEFALPGVDGIILKPSVGYYISNKTSIELNFSYATQNNIIIGNVASLYRSFAIVPTVRRYFINESKLRFFGELGFGLGTIKYDAQDENLRNFEHERSGAGISIVNIGIGGNYYFNDKFGLEIIVPYIRITNIISENPNNTFSGIGPTIGFTYKLN